jgi:hypothetical protein
MTQKIERMLRIIADGLACSAQAVAFHEGLPWDPDALRPAPKRRRIT